MGFLNAGLLWGLGLIAVPILIHLFNRRRFEVVRWAAMDFLLQAHRQNKRRVRLEHLLVLLLRCLAVALLALVVARPVVGAAGFAFLPGAQEAVERVILLDDSGSMGYSDGGGTRFAQARRVLARLVTDLRETRPRDLLTVVRASRADLPDVTLAALDDERAGRFLDRLDTLEPTSGRFDVADALGRVLAEREEGPERRVVYVITDLLARDWLGEHGRAAARIAEVLPERTGGEEGAPAEQASTSRVVLVPVGGGEQRNLGVTAFATVEKLALAGVPVELEVRVTNWGAAPVHGVPLALETSEGRVPLPAIEAVAPGEEVRVRHRTTFLEPGARALTVRLGEDALPLDDARHLALRVQERLQVLLVDGEPGSGPLENETDLLRLALSPPGEVLTGVEPTVVRAEGLPEEELSAFGSVVACNLDRWPPQQLDALRRFVTRGGGLAVFLGDRVTPQAWEDALYRAGLLPCPLGERREATREEDEVTVGPPEGDHPLTRVFAGENNPFLRRVRARTWMTLPLDAQRDADAKVVLRLADSARTPFVVERAVGKGRVVLFNASADLAWSTWPRSPSFPVVAQELVRLLAPPADAGRNVRCGEPIEWPLDPTRFLPTVALRPPAGEGEAPARELHAEPRGDGATAWASFDDTAQAGVYALELRPVTGEGPLVEQVAVNADAAEGDLAPASRPRLEQAFAAAHLEVAAPDDEGAVLAATEGGRTELWRTCLYALLAVLLLEQLLAWRAAHHRRPTASVPVWAESGGAL